MNRLSLPQQVQVVSLLTEGMSVWAVHRLTGIHRDTISRLGLTLGQACDRLHNARLRDLHIPIIQLDEQWAFVHTKQKNLKPDDDADYGDCYLWLAFDPASKVVLSYHAGKRTGFDAEVLLRDLHGRLLNRPQLNSDGFRPYADAIAAVFGTQSVDYGMIVKDANMLKTAVFGDPDLEQISTSLIERCNLTTRMGLRRHARRTNAHSKRLANHRAAIALHFAFYHWCRVHETLRVTPAMELGVAKSVWSVGELLERAQEAATQRPDPVPPKERPRLRVIRGGKMS